MLINRNTIKINWNERTTNLRIINKQLKII